MWSTMKTLFRFLDSKETSSIDRHGGASSNRGKKIAVVTNFSQSIRPSGKRVSEADLAYRKQLLRNKRFAGV